MKRIVLVMVLMGLLGVLLSCSTVSVSPPTTTNPYRPSGRIQNANIIDNISANFATATLIRGPLIAMSYEKAAITAYEGLISQINEAAYISLLEVAKKEHRGNIDIVDITWVFLDVTNSKVNYSANGKVVLLGGGNNKSTATGVEGALERAVNDVSKDFTSNARIAIVQITAPDRSTRDYMIGEIEFILQKQGYYLVDRAQLDKIFDEQRFGATSDVDDNTAARMGKVAGASIVITGRIDGEGNLRRLRLRALNTETARVVGAASERL
jgi:hypothetical protein